MNCPERVAGRSPRRVRPGPVFGLRWSPPGLPKPEMVLRDLRGTLRMPCSHFRGSGRGGFTPPVASTGRGGFTVNPSKLRVNGFIPPGDALRHGRSRKPFRMRRYEKSARKSFEIRTYKNKGLKVSWNEQLQKNRGVPPRASLPQCLSLTLNDEVHNVRN